MQAQLLKLILSNILSSSLLSNLHFLRIRLNGKTEVAILQWLFELGTISCWDKINALIFKKWNYNFEMSNWP